MSHVIHVTKSRHTEKRVMSHMWLSHVARAVMSHIHSISQVSRMNKSCHACERPPPPPPPTFLATIHALPPRQMSQHAPRVLHCTRRGFWGWHATGMWSRNYALRPILPPAKRRHDSFICDTTHPYAYHSFMCDTTHTYATTHSYVTRRIHMCIDSFISDTTHLKVWRDALMCVTWLINVCGMTH